MWDKYKCNIQQRSDVVYISCLGTFHVFNKTLNTWFSWDEFVAQFALENTQAKLGSSFLRLNNSKIDLS